MSLTPLRGRAVARVRVLSTGTVRALEILAAHDPTAAQRLEATAFGGT